jgi:hypothetical protein
MVSVGLVPFNSRGFLRGREPFASQLYSGSIGCIKAILGQNDTAEKERY